MWRVLVLGVLGVTALARGAEQAVLQPVADAAMYSENANNGDGGGQFFFAGKNSSGNLRRSVLRFDIAGSIPAGSDITAVSLQLTAANTQGTGNPATLHPLTESWNEGTTDATGAEGSGTAAAVGDTTWTSRNYNTVAWTTAGGAFNGSISDSIAITGAGSYTWPTSTSLVSTVQDWLDTPANNFGWILIGDETTAGATAKQFSSRSGTTPPVLTVTYLLAAYNPVLTLDPTAPLTALVGDVVNYTITVAGGGAGGDGSDAVHVTVVGDVSGVASYVSGDTNADNLLQASEIWTFSGEHPVQPTDPATLTNTFTVSFDDERGDPHQQQKFAQTTIDHLALHYVSGATIDAVQGDNVHLELVATGGHAAMANYQWRFNDGVHAPVLLGGNDPFLDVNAIQLSQAGNYACTVNDFYEEQVLQFTVNVVPRIPLAGGLGLALLTAILAGVGAPRTRP